MSAEGPSDARWAEVRAAWPEVSLSRAAFEEAVSSLEPSPAAGDEVEAEPRWAELFLAIACAQGDPAALRIFERRLLPQVDPAIRGIDGDPTFVDEVRQRVRTRLLLGEGARPPRIADYAGRGPLVGWMSVVALRTALNLLRERRRPDPLRDDGWIASVVLPSIDDVELEHLKASVRDDLAAALTRAFAELPARERAVLRLGVVDGLSIDRIAAIYGVHRSTAARWQQRARDEVRRATRVCLAERLQVTPTQLSSIDRLVHSQIDVSLGGLLAEPESGEARSPDPTG